MKTLQEFQSFYSQKLIVELRPLEEERKRSARKLLKVGLLAIVPFLALVIIAFSMFHGEALAGVLEILLGALLIPIALLGKRLFAPITDEFKQEVIQRIVSFVDNRLSYSPGSGIPIEEFMRSCIFTKKPNSYSCEDLVSGTLGATQMKCSEVCALDKNGSGDNERVTVIFKGMFYLADFNKKFEGQTIVLPDILEKTVGFLAKPLQSWNTRRGDLVKLEDPEFEKWFVVYSNDQVEARYILSPSLMERVVAFRKKTNRAIYLSFANSNVYVAIPVKKNLFEPDYNSMLNYDLLKEYFEYLQLTAGIVEDLNLNTRIWSKQ